MIASWRNWLTLGLFASCLFLSACGDDDNGTPIVATPTNSPTATNTATPTSPPTATHTPTVTATTTPTFTVPPTSTPTSTPTRTFTFTASPTFTATATASVTPTGTVTSTSTAEATATITPTPTITATPTVTATFGVLGERVFTLNQSKSQFLATIAPMFTIPLGSGFQGQNNGVVEPAFFRFVAGQPDPATGVATIDVTAASEFLFVDARSVPGANLVLCLKPMVPVPSAGFVACAGNLPFGFNLSQDHGLGRIGVDGFTPDDCANMNGVIESPNQVCAAGLTGEVCAANADCDTTTGAGDGVCGLVLSRCSAGNSGQECHANADCDTAPGAEDGFCGTPKPHPGVCNGPLNASQGSTDSGPGAVVIAPNPPLGTVGLPVRLSIQADLPCVDPGPDAAITFALTSDENVATILNFQSTADFTPGTTVTVTSRGENFSCSDWSDPNGPGKLVLNAPAIDQNPMGGDIISSFIFSGR
jgi:hypothetical protein